MYTFMDILRRYFKIGILLLIFFIIVSSEFDMISSLINTFMNINFIPDCQTWQIRRRLPEKQYSVMKQTIILECEQCVYCVHIEFKFSLAQRVFFCLLVRTVTLHSR